MKKTVWLLASIALMAEVAAPEARAANIDPRTRCMEARNGVLPRNRVRTPSLGRSPIRWGRAVYNHGWRFVTRRARGRATAAIDAACRQYNECLGLSGVDQQRCITRFTIATATISQTFADNE